MHLKGLFGFHPVQEGNDAMRCNESVGKISLRSCYVMSIRSGSAPKPACEIKPLPF